MTQSRTHLTFCESLTTVGAATSSFSNAAFTVPTDKNCAIRYRVLLRTNDADGYSGHAIREHIYKNISGTVSAVGTIATIDAKGDAPITGTVFDFLISGQTVTPRGTGVVGKTINWILWIDYWVL